MSEGTWLYLAWAIARSNLLRPAHIRRESSRAIAEFMSRTSGALYTHSLGHLPVLVMKPTTATERLDLKRQLYLTAVKELFEIFDSAKAELDRAAYHEPAYEQAAISGEFSEHGINGVTRDLPLANSVGDPLCGAYDALLILQHKVEKADDFRITEDLSASKSRMVEKLVFVKKWHEQLVGCLADEVLQKWEQSILHGHTIPPASQRATQPGLDLSRLPLLPFRSCGGLRGGKIDRRTSEAAVESFFKDFDNDARSSLFNGGHCKRRWTVCAEDDPAVCRPMMTMRVGGTVSAQRQRPPKIVRLVKALVTY